MARDAAAAIPVAPLLQARDAAIAAPETWESHTQDPRACLDPWTAPTASPQEASAPTPQLAATTAAACDDSHPASTNLSSPTPPAKPVPKSSFSAAAAEFVPAAVPVTPAASSNVAMEPVSPAAFAKAAASQVAGPEDPWTPQDPWGGSKKSAPRRPPPAQSAASSSSGPAAVAATPPVFEVNGTLHPRLSTLQPEVDEVNLASAKSASSQAAGAEDPWTLQDPWGGTQQSAHRRPPPARSTTSSSPGPAAAPGTPPISEANGTSHSRLSTLQPEADEMAAAQASTVGQASSSRGSGVVVGLPPSMSGRKAPPPPDPKVVIAERVAALRKIGFMGIIDCT